MANIFNATLLILLLYFARLSSTAKTNSSTTESLQDVMNSLKSTILIKDIFTCGNESYAMHSMTILTALLDIGVLPETDKVSRKDPALYLKWMEIYAVIQNPLIFFTDMVNAAFKMRSIRGDKPTVIVLIDKSSMWSFDYLAPKYEEIFADDCYPKHYPNTESVEYACVSHAKIELMQVASWWNYFHTDVIGWFDVGLYRDFVENGELTPFTLTPPYGFDRTKLTLNQVRPLRDAEPSDHRYIMRHSPTFFAGGSWLGSIDVMQTFTKEYMKTVETLLDEGLANCEEQVLATMFLGTTQFHPTVEVQLFSRGSTSDDPWLSLANSMRSSGLTTNHRVFH